MGEIKSTLELAMERTKRFAVSQKEKDAIKQKEISNKAASLFHRYREGHFPLNSLLKEIEGMEKRAAMTVREYLLSHWIDALSLDDENERTLKGVESLKGGSITEVKQRFRDLFFQYKSEKEKTKERVGSQLREALKEAGIWGSAVEPNLEGSELWEKESENLNRSYLIKLDEIKEQLKRL